jgi:dephospho-CoA kinase
MHVVALTGNIASGKSTVAQLIVAKGVPLIDADLLAREAVAPGSVALTRIVDRWGPAMIGSSGGLDRAALRAIVFGHPDQLAFLNAIVHPEVDRLRNVQLNAARERGVPIVLCDIPLLFEAKLSGEADTIILVDAPPAVRLNRLEHTRRLDRATAQAMIEAQMSSEEKRPLADFVIDNDGSTEQLRAAVDAVWRLVEKRAPSA